MAVEVCCWFSASEFPYYEFARNVVGVLCIVAILMGRLWFFLGIVGVGKPVGCKVGLDLADWWMR